ncbi:MAG TPA: MFS transporter [Trebonia sp.]|nr:MFS transporter [Trebonia sp.]
MAALPETSADGAADGHPKRGLVLVVLCAVAFMAQFDLFVANIALPSIGQSFSGQGLGTLSWVLNAYAIVFAAFLVPAGRLADHFGRRRFLLAGLATFTIASAVCAVAPSLLVLIMARAVQALGAAMIVPTSLGLLLPAFPKRQHNLVVGIWAGVAAVAATSGPPVGGLLVEASWRWVFLVNVPIGLVTLAGGRLVLSEIRAAAGARLPDPVSVLTALAAITALTLGTVQGSAWGWASGREVLVAVVFLATAGVTVRRTLTHRSPLAEPDLFRSRPFTAAVIALLMFWLSFAAWLLGTVLFFQNAWHYSTLQAGLAIAPGPLAAAVFATSSGRLAAIFSPRALAVAGPLLFAAGPVSWLVAATATPDYGAFLPGLIVAGMGSGLTQAPLLASVSTLPAHRATTGSAVLNMARQVGSALGVAIVVAIYASPSPHSLAAFRRGWVLGIIALLIASAASLLVRPGRAVSNAARVSAIAGSRPEQGP